MNRRNLLGAILVPGLLAAGLWIGSLPGLRTLPGGTSIAGCDHPRDDNAAGVCPQLICTKALREHAEIDDRAHVSFDTSFVRANGKESLHVGTAQWRKDGTSEKRTVRCLMDGDTVVKSGPITADERSRIVYSHEWL